ncbi:MAG: preprotein translocase subunit SecE [Gemmataceae bacterium]
MAVAVKNKTETTPPSKLSNQLPIASLLGVCFLLGSIGVVFYAIPKLWWSVIHPVTGLPFIDATLLLLLMGAAVGGLGWLGMRLLAPLSQPGLRAGIFSGSVGVVLIALLTIWVGSLLQGLGIAGLVGMVAVGFALLAGAWIYFQRSSTEQRLIAFEEQGWFTVKAYKRSQGLQVRRATILAILLLGGSGIYTLIARYLLRMGTAHWEVTIPFTDGVTWVLLPNVQYSLPLILIGLTLWLAFRIVNFPPFADFLIATEAEMRKVSWTTRKRLVQDTIVVLVMVMVMAIFLFGVDRIWYEGLQLVGVLDRPDQKNPEKVIGSKY